MKKLAFSRNWIRSRGDRYVDQNIDSMMTDPKVRAQLFDQAAGRSSPESVSGLQRLNPFAYLRKAYAEDPRSREHFEKVLKTRLNDPTFREKMFGERRGITSSLYNLAGPAGRLGAVGGLLGRVVSAIPGGRRIGNIMSGAGLATLLGSGAYRTRVAKDPGAWSTAFGEGSQNTMGKEMRDRLSSLSTLMGSIAAPGVRSPSEVPPGVKLAFIARNPSFGIRTDFTADRTGEVSQLLKQHFPVRYARDLIMADPNIGFLDKAKIIGSVYKANGGKDTGSVNVADVTSSLIGAGMGYTGATLVSNLLNLPPAMSTAVRIGSSLAGAALNNPRVFKI